jgi:cysteine synthase A
MNSSALDAIGNTPLIRLARLPSEDMAEVWVKLEGANPTGSMKDRMARAMVEGGEARGELRPGGRVVEYTGGSTGASLAFVCAVKGHRAHLVSSDAFSLEKRRMMRAFGAVVEEIPSDGGRITPDLVPRMIERARELAQEPDTFFTAQFDNPDNAPAYAALAEEVEDALGVPDAFVASVGSGGCLSGAAGVFKARRSDVQCVAVEPAAAPNLSGGPLGSHRLEGIGVGFLPPRLRTDLVDSIEGVSDEESFETARRLGAEEGVFGGITSGTNVAAALRVARRLGPGKRVVTVIVDSGLKYVSGDLYANEAS